MWIWKLERTVDVDYDEHDAFVIAAETEAQAHNIAYEACYDRERRGDWLWSATAERVGQAFSDIKQGVIVSSFNAG